MSVKELSDGNPDGTRLGQDADDLVGFWGATPVDQPANIADVTTTAATNSSPYGFASAAQASALVANVNAIIAALEEVGILASS